MPPLCRPTGINSAPVWNTSMSRVSLLDTQLLDSVDFNTQWVEPVVAGPGPDAVTPHTPRHPHIACCDSRVAADAHATYPIPPHPSKKKNTNGRRLVSQVIHAAETSLRILCGGSDALSSSTARRTCRSFVGDSAPNFRQKSPKKNWAAKSNTAPSSSSTDTRTSCLSQGEPTDSR